MEGTPCPTWGQTLSRHCPLLLTNKGQFLLIDLSNQVGGGKALFGGGAPRAGHRQRRWRAMTCSSSCPPNPGPWRSEHLKVWSEEPQCLPHWDLQVLLQRGPTSVCRQDP